MNIPVGEAMLGRVVDPLGNPIDGAGEIKSTGTRPVERIAPGVCDRQPVTEPLQTGIKSIDMMIPIGRGQHMNLSLAIEKQGRQPLQLIPLSIKETDVICIYGYGQKNQPLHKSCKR